MKSIYRQPQTIRMIAGCWLGGPFCLVYEDDEGALLGLIHYLFYGAAWTREHRHPSTI
ncbi:MAG: hypothetical protein QMB78_03620 [Rhodospirillales bacterium]